jgi:hypothetical protein
MNDKRIKEMVNNAKNNIELLLKNTPLPVEIQYKKDDKIVSSMFDILKLAQEGRLLFFKKEEIDKFAKHMKTQLYNKTDWKLLQNKFRADLYFWVRERMIAMSEEEDNSFYGSVLFNANIDNQDSIKFAFQPITKQQYEEIVKEATETSIKISQEIANNMPKEWVEQAINQLTPEEDKEVMDELKKIYNIDEETGTITKIITD